MQTELQKVNEEAPEQHFFTGFTHVKFNFDNPFPMKAELMELTRLSLFCGQNGSGKSFIFKFLFFGSLFLQSKMASALQGIALSEAENLGMAQFYIDGIFLEPDMNGSVSFYQGSDAYISINVNFENGKITKLEYTFPENCVPCGKVQYLTKDTRTFNQLESYLQIKDMLGISTFPSTEEEYKKILKMFRLHDMMAFESAATKMKSFVKQFNDVVTTEDAKESSEKKEYGAFDMVVNFGVYLMGYNEEKKMATVFMKGHNTEKLISSLGAGEQSMIMMIMQNMN